MNSYANRDPGRRRMSTQPVAAPKQAGEDFMPLHGIDHVELWVGNAAQAAYFYREAFGFEQVAYAGLETGVRDRVSFVMRQGRIRLVLTGALTPGHEIGDHHRLHGDGEGHRPLGARHG